MEPTLKQSYKILQIIYASLISGIILFQLITLKMNGWEVPEFMPGMDPLNIISLLMLAMIPVGKIVSDRFLKAIQDNLPAQQKMMKVQSALIIRWASIEGTALFSIVVFLMLQDGKQLIVFLLCIAAIAMASPSKEKIARWGKFTSEEIRDLA